MADKVLSPVVESVTEAPEGKQYPVLDGSTQLATIPQWDNVSANYEIIADTDNDDGYIVPAAAPVTEIGRVGANYHSGNIKSVSLIDHTPLQGGRFMPGDGVSRYAAIPEITLAGDFEIEFWWVRQDLTGTGFNGLIGYSASSSEFLAAFDTGSATFPDAVRVNFAGAAITFLNALAGVALGQHCAIKISRSGGAVECFVDGVSKGVGADSASFEIDQFMRLGSGAVAAGMLSAMAIRDLETGQVWKYKNRNDSGNLLLNSSDRDVLGAVRTEATPAVANLWEITGNNYRRVGASTWSQLWLEPNGSDLNDELVLVECEIKKLSGDNAVYVHRRAEDDSGNVQIVELHEGHNRVAVRAHHGISSTALFIDNNGDDFEVLNLRWRRIHALGTAEGEEVTPWGTVTLAANQTTPTPNFLATVGAHYKLTGVPSTAWYNFGPGWFPVPASGIVAATGVGLKFGNYGGGGTVTFTPKVTEVTHGLWHQSGSVMTAAAADAARTRLPMISRHYLFDEPGRIKEVLGGGADATLINLDASDWQTE